MSARGRGPRAAAAGHYATPHHAVNPILNRLPDLSDKIVYDLGCGTGSIMQAVHARYPSATIIGFEISRRLAEQAARNCPWAQVEVHDLMAKWGGGHADVAIFNPPFELAQEFVQLSLAVADVTCCLQRLNWLGGGGSPKALPETRQRLAWWLANPLPALTVLSRRPSFARSKTGSTTDASEYAFFSWGGRFMPGSYEIAAAEEQQDPTFPPTGFIRKTKIRGGRR